MKRKRGGDGVEVERGQPDAQVVGKGGEGFQYAPSEDESSEESQGLGPATLYNMAHLSISQESISTLNSDDLSTEDYRHAGDSSRTASFGSVASDDSTGASGRQAVDFHHDAAASIFDSLQKGDESSNIQLELTALRMTADASPHQVRRAMVAAFMKRIATLMESGLTAAQAVKTTIPPQAILLKRTMYDYGEKFETKEDQLDFLLLMQTDVCHRVDGEKVMLFASNELALLEIVETEGFEQWWEDDRSQENDELVRIRKAMVPFMDAIVEEETDEETDSDDE